MTIVFPGLQAHARKALQQTVDAGAGHYDRARMLPRILPLGPADITGPEPAATRKIVLKLARALRETRRLGRAGHWSYDLNRHIALAQAFRVEQERLQRHST